MTERPARPDPLERFLDEIRDEDDLRRHVLHFAAMVERNKTRRRRDDDPPAALPVPATPRRGGPFLKGGAAAALVFENA